MPRPDARPARLQMDRIATQHEELDNEKLEDFFKHRQIFKKLHAEDLEVLSELGSGNGGYVSKVKHTPTGQVLARKVIRLEVNLAEKNRILQELDILMDCNNPYIVGYFGAYHKNGEINLFMEYMDGRSLDSILRKTPRIGEDILGKITVSVIEGLSYLRDKLSIMHRDIKPSNILVNSQGQIKICDFGVSGHLIDSIAQSFVGTRQYMSPERLTGHPYTVQSDIWSLGLTLVELALGVYPIPQKDPIDMYYGRTTSEVSNLSVFALMEWIVNQPPPTIPGPPIFTSEFKDFVDKCLKKLPEERFDLRTIRHHQFFLISEKMTVALDNWVCQVCSAPDSPKSDKRSPKNPLCPNS